jgi:hypothetical protein
MLMLKINLKNKKYIILIYFLNKNILKINHYQYTDRRSKIIQFTNFQTPLGMKKQEIRTKTKKITKGYVLGLFFFQGSIVEIKY